MTQITDLNGDGDRAVWERYLVLDKLKVRVNYTEGIGLHMRNSMDFAVWRDHLADRMIYQLQAEVLTEKIVEKRIEKKAFFRATYPKTWWQAFKDDVLDRFALTRWFVRWRPVEWEVIEQNETLVADFRQFAKYPAADVVFAPDTLHRGVIVGHEEITWT